MSNHHEFNQHIIIDLGSSEIKCGLNGEICPRFVIPNVIGTPKKTQFHIDEDDSSKTFGREALYNSSILDLHYLKENGKIATSGDRYEMLESMFEFIIHKGLKVNIENYNVFIIDSLFTSLEEKEAIAKMLFEKFTVYNIHMQPQSILTLYSTAKTSGLIIQSGEIETEIIPIYEGYILSQGIITSPIAGKYMTNQFVDHLHPVFKKYGIENEFNQAKKIKEQLIEILPEDYYKTKTIPPPVKYELPDGNKIDIGDERFFIPEKLFELSIDGQENKSLQEMLAYSLEHVDTDLRKEFWSNIILGGGNILLKGLNERLLKEATGYLGKFSLSTKALKIEIFPETKYSSWCGASSVCSFSQFNDKWITRSEYEEKGAKILKQSYLYDITKSNIL